MSQSKRYLAGLIARFRNPDGHWNLSLFLDVVMVQLAFLNLLLLSFDVTYLHLRPTWNRFLPRLVELYDPAKGIVDQPRTTQYLELVDSLATDLDEGELQNLLAELRRLGQEAADHRPFARSGQEDVIRSFEARLLGYVVEKDAGEAMLISPLEAMNQLWTPGDRQELEANLKFFDSELRPLFELNYHRTFSRDGDYVDHGWWLDLPFLLIFTIEFYGQWIMAIRQRRYAEWWVYPLIHWYDFLGIVPLPQFRIFRLFRLVSLYLRLHRSSISSVGDDVVSRTVSWVARLVTEEVTDRVTVRILGTSQEALAGGIQGEITREVLEPRRDLLVEEISTTARRVLAASDFHHAAREFLDQNLQLAIDHSPGLRLVPLPRVVLEPLVSSIGEAVFDSVVQTLGATLESDEGRQAFEALVGDAVDGLIDEFTVGSAEALLRESLVETLEEVKKRVGQRDWTGESSD